MVEFDKECFFASIQQPLDFVLKFDGLADTGLSHHNCNGLLVKVLPGKIADVSPKGERQIATVLGFVFWDGEGPVKVNLISF